jgi:hypothetical protein
MWKNGGNPDRSASRYPQNTPTGFPPFFHNRFENSFAPRCPPLPWELFPKGVFNNPLENSSSLFPIPTTLIALCPHFALRLRHAEFSTFPQGLLSLFFSPRITLQSYNFDTTPNPPRQSFPQRPKGSFSQPVSSGRSWACAYLIMGKTPLPAYAVCSVGRRHFKCNENAPCAPLGAQRNTLHGNLVYYIHHNEGDS